MNASTYCFLPIRFGLILQTGNSFEYSLILHLLGLSAFGAVYVRVGPFFGARLVDIHLIFKKYLGNAEAKFSRDNEREMS